MIDMKTVCVVNQCAGCMACVDICPKNAIKIEDSMEYYNAVIDESKCVGCNACLRVCQQMCHHVLLSPLKWFQGWANNLDVRLKGASGGVAYAIERQFIKDGGIVLSCTFDEGMFKFGCADTEQELIRFVGSKYVKSNPAGIYKLMIRHLNAGKKVLFVGLPCQVAAARNYMKDSDINNFYSIDLICHGTPSPGILECYLKQYGLSLKSVDSLKFRTKTRFQILSGYNPVEGEIGICDHYSTAFLNCVCYTENCYACNYAKKERISDITLGDSWGTKLESKQVEKGISLVLCQTRKGEDLLRNSDLYLMELDEKGIANAIANNHQLQQPSQKPTFRERFFDEMKDEKKFNTIVRHYYPWICFKQLIKKMLIKIGLIHQGGDFLGRIRGCGCLRRSYPA